jgi:cation transport ATPase
VAASSRAVEDFDIAFHRRRRRFAKETPKSGRLTGCVNTSRSSAGRTVWRGEPLKLGSVAWCAAEAEAAPVAAAWPDASLIVLRAPERAAVFAVRQRLRSDARAVVAGIARRHAVEIVSGDREPAVALAGRRLG